MSQQVECPKCGERFEITDVLQNQLREQIRKEFEAEVVQRQRAIEKREAELRSQYERREEELKRNAAAMEQERKKLQAQAEQIEEQVRAKLELQRKEVLAVARKQAEEELGRQLQEREEMLARLRMKVEAAQKEQVALLKLKEQLEEEKREFELTVAKTLDAERARIRETAQKELAEQRDLKEKEKDKLIEDLRKQMEEMKRKAEQGSQQAQGEVLELDFEDQLRQAFPMDRIEPVPKGVHGGDVVQRVVDQLGMECGVILWECKRTKNWSDTWLAKLRNDQRAAKAHAAILVSTELPRNVSHFQYVEGVWVTGRPCALGLALAIRAGLLQVAAARRAGEGQHTKIEMLYDYITSNTFRQRVEAIVESFRTLKENLDKEKRSLQRLWSEREKQIERAIMGTAGLYGDLSGIVGRSLPSVSSLELPEGEDAAVLELEG
jgi:hypothetical protein